MGICIFDHPVKSWMESNYTSMDTDKINNLTDNARALYADCLKFGMICPTIRINKNETIMKYDCNNRYVHFIIKNDIVSFIYSNLDKKPIDGILKDTDKQLKILSKFLYQGLN
jgi:hypothetical protein